jgi:hypothetical protein
MEDRVADHKLVTDGRLARKDAELTRRDAELARPDAGAERRAARRERRRDRLICIGDLVEQVLGAARATRDTTLRRHRPTRGGRLRAINSVVRSWAQPPNSPSAPRYRPPMSRRRSTCSRASPVIGSRRYRAGVEDEAAESIDDESPLGKSAEGALFLIEGRRSDRKSATERLRRADPPWPPRRPLAGERTDRRLRPTRVTFDVTRANRTMSELPPAAARLLNSPYKIRQFSMWGGWGGWDSNPRPRDYESPALTS